MTPPTPAQIARLIARRERLTNRRDERINFPAVKEIDAQLAQVPAGERNDVDLLLGRPCAQLSIPAAVVRALEADEQRELMTMAEVLAGRAAAGMCDADEMRSVKQDALNKHRYTWRGCAGNSADEYDSGSEGHW